MAVIVQNMNTSLKFCLTVLNFFCFLPMPPITMTWLYAFFFNLYWFTWFMFLLGGAIITQAGAILLMWGDLTSMTSASFLLFTNLAMAIKIINVVMRNREIQDIIIKSDEELRAERRVEGIQIIKRSIMPSFEIECEQEIVEPSMRDELTSSDHCTTPIAAFSEHCMTTTITISQHFVDNFIIRGVYRPMDKEAAIGCETLYNGLSSSNRETTWSLCVFMWLAAVTVVGWATSAEKNQLPLRAWYPYETSKSPVYELTYAYQCSALILSAMVNVCLDTLVTSLVAICCCRLRLVALSLRTLCDVVPLTGKQILSVKDEEVVQKRLQHCVRRHEAALRTAAHIQTCFSRPILAQFSVSTVIMCVTAYQLALEVGKRNWVRIISMVAYLLCMMLQVFLYCYQGNQISKESSAITDAAYWCPWYMCSVRLRRALLIVMIRTRRVVKLTAGGFTTLSLECFTAILKASYTFFTVLKQMDDRN